MSTIEALRKTARRAQEAIGEIETVARRKENAKKVGKFFKTQNSYSCPEKPSDYWWLYAKCIRMDEDGFLYSFQFQTDKNGCLDIRPEHYSYYLNGFSEIPKTEFERAWKTLLEKLNSALTD